MATNELVMLVLPPGSAHYEDALPDPLAFVERRRGDLDRVAGERLHGQRLLPLTRLTRWAVVLPGSGLDRPLADDFATLRATYGDGLADLLERGVAEHRDAIVLWRVVKCVPKGQG